MQYYQIHEVSDLAGVSVRTLHHYDHIGLLVPESATPAGYRLYSDTDVERLQHILFFRELGFTLKETGNLLDSPGFDRRRAYEAHLDMLLLKRKRLDDMIGTVERAMSALEGGKSMKKDEMFGSFDMSAVEEAKKKYSEEARQKWGKTDAWKESQKRTSRYSEADWKRIQEEGNRIFAGFARLRGTDPASQEVQDLVDAWRSHISENFYSCSVEILRGLGEMYTADERFLKNIDAHGEGTAELMSKAISIYCSGK